MYIQRDSNLKIIGVYAHPQVGYAEEYLSEDAPEVLEFLSPVMPDGEGFTQAIKTSLGGILAANTLMVAYPAFLPAVQAEQWADVQALLIDAQAKSALTTTQYDAIKAAALSFNIPVTL